MRTGARRRRATAPTAGIAGPALLCKLATVGESRYSTIMLLSCKVAAWSTVIGALVGMAAGCNKSKDAAPGAAGESPAASGSAPAAVPAAGPSLSGGFEGELDFMYTAKAEGAAPVPATILVKGSKARVDIPEAMARAAATPFAANAYIVLDGDAKKLYAVLDARKEVVVVDLNRAGDMTSPPMGGPHEHGADPQRPPTKVTKTGQYDTIAGYKCENWTVASDHKEATVCVAEQGFSWFNYPVSGLPADRLWAAELMDGKHFPLRYIAYGKDGVTELSKVEATKLEKKDVPDAEFQYPPSYAVMDMASMMRAFMGGGMPARMPAGMPAGMAMPPGMAIPPHAKGN